MKTQFFQAVMVALAVLAVAGPAASASERIFFEDFEADGLELSDVFFTSNTPPDNYVAIVTNQPHGGNKCIRGNVYPGATDPITGLPGQLSPMLNIGGNTGTPLWGTYRNFRNYHTNELYISWWMRWDENANFTRGGGYSGAYKLMYISGTGGVEESYNNRYNNRLSFYNSYISEGEGSVYGRPLIVGGGNDGAWHHYEVYIRYESSFGATDGIWRLWEDGELCWERTDAHWLRTSTGKIQNLRFIHYTLGADASSGWQIDDIEVWNGMPDGGDTTPPDPPENVEAVAVP